MRELKPIEIHQVGGGVAQPVHISMESYLGALLTPWAAAPTVSISSLALPVVTLQVPSWPQGVDHRTAGS